MRVLTVLGLLVLWACSAATEGAGGKRFKWPPDPSDDPYQIVFVTSKSGTGQLSSWPNAGTAGSNLLYGQNICVALATAAQLPNPSSFKVWLSDSGSDAKNRLTNTSLPYVNTQGEQIASDFADLVDGSAVAAALNHDEEGNTLSSDVRVFTGTSQTGTRAAGSDATLYCSNWGSTAITGIAGNPSSVSGWSSGGTNRSCSSITHLLCVQDRSP